VAYRQTQFQIDLQQALLAAEPKRGELLAALAKKLEELYARNPTDEKAAEASKVSVATLKRLIARLAEAGHPPKISRPRGRRWAPKPPGKRARRTPLQGAQA